ncbi:MAG: helix-turn-helix transcriptional regulator [Microcoleaceae cyanobacterium]
MMTQNTSDLILQMRKRLGLSQERLAVELGVSFYTVNRWERGHTKPSRLAWVSIEQKLKQMENEGEDLLASYYHQSKNKCGTIT